MRKFAKAIFVLTVIAFGVASGNGTGIKAAMAQQDEVWAGCPSNSNTCDSVQTYSTAEEACESTQYHYIPYFGYTVNGLISITAAKDHPDPSGIYAQWMACILDATPNVPTDTIYVEFGCSNPQDVASNGVCLPPGTPQDAEPLCGGNHGSGGDCPTVGDPVSISSGAKVEIVTDYSSGGKYPLEIKRYYRSLQMPTDGISDGLGVAWRTDIVGRQLDMVAAFSDALIRREDGVRSRFFNPYTTYPAYMQPGQWPQWSVAITPYGSNGCFFTNGCISRETDAKDSFSQLEAGGIYQYTDENDRVDVFNSLANSSGPFVLTQTTWRGGYQRTYTYDGLQLSRIDDNLGRSVTVTWQSGVITNIGLPGGLSIQYTYQFQYLNGSVIPGTGLLTQVTRYNADGSVIDSVSYQYDLTNLNAPRLTGVVDANGAVYETATYDTHNRVLTAQRASGAGQVSISYDDVANTRTVTNALGQTNVYKVEMVGGIDNFKVYEVDGNASGSVAAASSTRQFDANGFLSQRTDWNGAVYKYTNDAQGRETQRIEDYGGLARTTNTTWSSTFRLPTEIQAPNLTIDYTYDAQGNLTQRKETDTTPHGSGGVKIWNYTYDPTGLLLTVQGPRTDVNQTTTYTYDANGNLATVKNALNQTTTITAVDPRGLPLSITDPNGVVTNLTYDGVGRVTGATIEGSSPAMTSFSYDLNGLLTQLVLPNGVTLTYSYDAAHRLTGVSDSAGDQIAFTLDGLGNRTQTQILSGSAQVLMTHSATFDTLGRLLSSIGAANQVTDYQYDGNGNLTKLIDPRNAATLNAFDGLNRLKQITDPLNDLTKLTLDLQDNVTAVTDPNVNATTYTRNGFGEVTQVVSPDSGTTALTRDAAGNIISKKDARNVVTNYTYDALNRVTSRTYPSDTAENVTFTYDQTASGNAGIGKLTSMADAAGSASFVYDDYGNTISVTRTISGVPYVTSYGYDLAGNVTQIVYPSGRIVNYQRDALGYVATVTTQANGGAGAVTLASNILYMPFGPASSLTLGNGQQITYGYDEDYRLTNIVAASPTLQNLTLGYDPASNIASIADGVNSNRSQTFQYDVLGRVTQAVGFYGTDTMTYDGVGNVLTRSRTGTSSVTYSYNRNSNQLSKAVRGGSTYNYTYDADGNMLTRALGRTTQLAIAYNADARPKTAATETFTYDGFGERSVIAATGGGTHDIFGLGHELLAENNTAGQAQRSYIYLNGRPLAVVDSLGNIFYVLSGQLGQPLRMVDGLGNVIWDVALDEFGQLVSQPVGQTSANALRFPGQIDDAVTGLYYNYFRDYEPALGRYVQPDPFGLRGGINVYAYVNNNPMAQVDPLGEYGFGVTGSASVEGGFPYIASGGGTVSAGAGFLYNDTIGGSSAGGYFSHGEMGQFLGRTSTDPCESQSPEGALGAYAGAGLGAFITNADTWNDLFGPFQTWSINTPIGSAQFSYSNGTWIGSVTVGPGYIGGVSAYPTVTSAAGGMPLQ
jgi:RHS repeat-associated protein